mgnify:CR=1 FL=1
MCLKSQPLLCPRPLHPLPLPPEWTLPCGHASASPHRILSEPFVVFLAPDHHDLWNPTHHEGRQREREREKKERKSFLPCARNLRTSSLTLQRLFLSFFFFIISFCVMNISSTSTSTTEHRPSVCGSTHSKHHGPPGENCWSLHFPLFPAECALPATYSDSSPSSSPTLFVPPTDTHTHTLSLA